MATTRSAASIVFLLIVIALISALVFGVHLVVKFLRNRKQEKASARLRDLEANMSFGNIKGLNESLSTPLSLSFYLSAIACLPTAYLSPRSRKHRHLTRSIPNPFVVKPSTSANSFSSMPTTTVSDNSQGPAPTRPPRSGQMDSVLADLPEEGPITNDVWFPVANRITGRWELCVVRARDFMARRTPSSSLDMELSVSHPDDRKRHGKGKKDKKSGKDRKRKGWGYNKRRLEIPELYVNARSYDEIMAEAELGALAARNSSTSSSNGRNDPSEVRSAYDTKLLYPKI